jgi:hypothetical protein
MSFWLTRLGSLLAGGGLVWAAYVATLDVRLDGTALQTAAQRVYSTRGPLELAAGGIILWLLGHWRRHTRVE